MIALLNGTAPDAASLLHSRALHYGDGVFRTALIVDGAVHERDRQIERLRNDAERIGLASPSAAVLAGEADALAAGQERAVLKLMLVRRAGGRGYRATDDGCDRLLLRTDLPEHPRANWTAGVRLFRSAHVLPEQAALAGVKHLNRLDNVLASRDWPADAEEGILCDAAGRPIGGTRSNLFGVEGGTLWTPALDRCGIDGITRNKIIELADSLQVKTDIRTAPWAALDRATELFVCNALIGIWPVRALCGSPLPAPGPITRALMQALRHPVP